MHYYRLIVFTIILFSVVTCYGEHVADSTERQHAELSKAALSNDMLQIYSSKLCMDNSMLTINHLHTVLYPKLGTLEYNIDGNVTLQEKVILKTVISVYGLAIISRQIDLCSLNQKGICPLRPGRIDIKGTYKIPQNVIEKIPKPIFVIPNLDLEVDFLLYNHGDTELLKELACVQVHVTNNKTVTNVYAFWITAALSISILLASIYALCWGYTLTNTYLLFTVYTLFAHIQGTAMLRMLTLPIISSMVQSWIINYQWSLGTIPSRYVQGVADWYVLATSTYPFNHMEAASFINPERYRLSSDETLNVKAEEIDTNKITLMASETMKYLGAHRYAFREDFISSNIFVTSIITLASLIVVTLIFLNAVIISINIMIKIPHNSKFNYIGFLGRNYTRIIKANLFRVLLILFPPIVLISVSEFNCKSSPALLVDAVVIFAIALLLLLYAVYRLFIQARKSKRTYGTVKYSLFVDDQFVAKYGLLFLQFKSSCYWWLLVQVVYGFAKPFSISMSLFNGKLGVTALFVTELIYSLCSYIFQPYISHRMNQVHFLVHGVTVLHLFFFFFLLTLSRHLKS
ncbi:hypothetical protein KAFR_0C04970 [Kazachstania africana CBS 2517]|uniref:ML-like domain-containing protein n=1 Tax=Kazachstania africana (strain ATCC 22294 / BCRC 22015 / CBS 2517 / CECT 1963 / NBRC 1671 / NRRL Y-8276) TaxID=1071382 RepID=H2ASY8_KAZAF|nr:hypothetical protein KAFR_0C04970 [Kazachstania africana CBS 2517]CCF57488.1 hypothetical protein KAFR_0C04970 [Kazachstania africana CBS 2517]